MNWSLVQQLASKIVSAARFHERPQDMFPWETVAALMGAHIAQEKRPGVRQVVDVIGDTLADLGLMPNASTGLANLRPNVVQEILEQKVRLQPETLNELQCVYSDNKIDTADYRGIHSSLQKDEISLDLLGANVERGIDKAKQQGLRPSIFNVGNWLWNGVQSPKVFWEELARVTRVSSDPTLIRGAYGHGLVMTQQIQQAAQVLGVTLSGFSLYNKTPSNPRTDESVFAECELRTSAITSPFGAGAVAWKQNSICGASALSFWQFRQQYGDYLRAFDLYDKVLH